MTHSYEIAVYDLNGNRLCHLYSSKVEQDGAARDIKIKKEGNGWKQISFELSSVMPDGSRNYRWDLIRCENLLHIWEDGKEDLYTIKEPTLKHQKGILMMDVSCDHISEELKSKNLYGYFDEMNGIDTCETLVRTALQGTGWTLGAHDVLLEADGTTEKIRSYTCDVKTGAYKMISDIMTLFGAYPVFNGIERTVEFYSNKNYVGIMEINYGKNMDSITRKKDSSNLVTRLYVEGEYNDVIHDYIGIDDVNPTGLNFLLNFDYFKEIGYFTDEHQSKLDAYIQEYSDARKNVKDKTTEMLNALGELLDLIGTYRYVYYPVNNGVVDTVHYIAGSLAKDGTDKVPNPENDLILKNKDRVYVVAPDGSFVYGEYEEADTTSAIAVIKIIPVCTGKLAVYEDMISALGTAINTLVDKLNKLLIKDRYLDSDSEKITIEKLHDIYGVDLSIVVDNEETGYTYDITQIPEEYREEFGKEYIREVVGAIGKNENFIEEDKQSNKEDMLKIIADIKLADELKGIVATATQHMYDVDSQFAVDMGIMLRDGYYSDDKIGPEQELTLMEDAIEVLKKLSKPEISYSINILDLGVLDRYKGEDFNLYQAVRIYDQDAGINDYGVVTEINIYPDKPSSDSIKIDTDLLNIGSKSFSTILERMTELSKQYAENKEIFKRATAINKDGSISSNLLEGAIDVNRTKIGSTVSNWSTDEKGNIIFTALDGQSAMMLSGAGFMIANSKDENGNWDWRSFGSGDGFTADMIVAGTINTRRLSPGLGEELDISSNTSINLLSDRIDDAEGSIEAAEQKITPDAIISTVAKGLSGEDVDETTQELLANAITSTVKSDSDYTQVKQTADKINWIVSDGKSSSDMTLTQDALNVIADNINFTANEGNFQFADSFKINAGRVYLDNNEETESDEDVQSAFTTLKGDQGTFEITTQNGIQALNDAINANKDEIQKAQLKIDAVNGTIIQQVMRSTEWGDIKKSIETLTADGHSFEVIKDAFSTYFTETEEGLKIGKSTSPYNTLVADNSFQIQYQETTIAAFKERRLVAEAIRVAQYNDDRERIIMRPAPDGGLMFVVDR